MPLWLVPGFTQTPSSWDAVVATLFELGSRDARPVDVPRGRSFANAAHDLARRHGAGTWCGYSMGGRLALQLALDAPAAVEQLVLVSATAGIDDATERAARRAADSELAQSIERDGVDAFLTRWLAQPLFASVPPDAPGLDDRRAWSAPELAGMLRDLGTGEMDPLWDRLGELHMPVLIVHGTRDAKYSALAERLAGGIRGARCVGLDCGHAVPLERPAELARLLHEIHKPSATRNASTS